MEKKGYLIAQTYLARMAVPLEGVSVTVTTDSENPFLIAYEKTDINGKTQLVSIDTPNLENSLSPSGGKAFASCNIRLDHPDYYTTIVKEVQIFSGEESIQQMEMIPKEEFPTKDQQSRTYVITPQDL
ncbi:MAG: hypothetical protein RSD88_02840 [Anaerovoracaceae bacterium]